MSESQTGHPCANHPVVLTAQTCSRCGRPFCEACLTELLGGRVCGWCRDLHLRTLQKPRAGTEPRTIVLFARIYDGLVLVLGGAFGVIMGFYAMLMGATAGRSPGMPPSARVVMSSAMTTAFLSAGGVLIVLLVIYLPPLLLLGKRRAGLWTWQFCALIAGTIGGCLMSTWGFILIPISILLAVYWLRPEVRAYLEGA